MKPLAIVATHPIQYQAPLYEYLAANGFSIHVFFLSDQGVSARHDADFGRPVAWDLPLLEGYPHEFLPNTRRNGGTERFLGLVNPRIVTRLLTGDFSAVLVHGHRNLSMVLAGMSARLCRIPLLYRGERCRPASQTLRRIGGPQFRCAVSACLSIGSLNDQFYASLGIPRERRFFMPYVVDNQRFQEAASSVSKTDARRALGIDTPELVLLFAGKLAPWKQPDMLLRAFASVARDDMHMVIAGEGVMRASLEDWATRHLPGRVTFLGFLNQTEIPLAYRSADLLALPSSREPWGLVVNEVMNFAVPVLVSDQVGCGPDLVMPGRTGDVFAANDLSSLTRSLRGLLHDPVRLTAMGSEARSHISGWGFPEAAAGLAAALHSLGAG